MKEGNLTYRPYMTITRHEAFARGFGGPSDWLHVGLEYETARDLIRQADGIAKTEIEARKPREERIVPHYIERVDFCSPAHNTPRSRYDPAPGVIIHLKRYRRRPIVRVSNNSIRGY
jgi:hypothetical protein